MSLQITDTNPNDFPPYPSVAEATGVSGRDAPGGIVYPGPSNGYDIYDVDYALARSKGLIGSNDGFTDTYLKLQAVYRKAFNDLINQNGALSKVDAEFAQAPEKYVPATAQQMGIYQKYGSYDYKYIYLDNDFRIEELDQSDLELLADPTPQNMPAIEQMVKRTFVSVVTMYTPDGTPGGLVSHNPVHLHLAAVDAVVLVIRYTGKLDHSATTEQLTAADNKAKTIAKNLEKQLKTEFGGDFTVFVDTI